MIRCWKQWTFLGEGGHFSWEEAQLMEMEFYYYQEKYNNDQISYNNYYENGNFHRAKRFQSLS